MATHHPRPRILCPIALTHQPCPDAPSSPELRNLFKQIIMHIEEEGETWRKLINLQPSRKRRLNIRQPIRNRKGQLLHSRRPSLADMIATNTNGIPARHVTRPKLDRVYHQTHRRLWWKEKLL